MTTNTKASVATVIGLIGMACMFSGCMTPQQKEQTCQTAQYALEAYQAVLAAGHVPSQAEIIAATAGAAFLHAYCNWTTAPAESSTGRSYVIDMNGVLIVQPPKVQ